MIKNFRKSTPAKTMDRVEIDGVDYEVPLIVNFGHLKLEIVSILEGCSRSRAKRIKDAYFWLNPTIRGVDMPETFETYELLTPSGEIKIKLKF